MGKYYWTCPYCNANLDPGERCYCDESRIAMGRTNNYKSVQQQGGDKHNDKTTLQYICMPQRHIIRHG